MKKLFTSVLFCLGTSAWLLGQVGEELHVRAALPPNIQGLTSTKGGSIEIRLGVDLNGEDISLYPFAKNELKGGVVVESDGQQTFDGKLEWIALGTKAFFPKNQGVGGLSKTISPLTPTVIHTATTPSGSLEKTALKFSVTSLVIVDSAQSASVGTAGFDPRSRLFFKEAKDKVLYLSAKGKDNQRRLFGITIGEFDYWKKAKVFWQVGSTPDQATIKRIKNTLFRTLLTPDGQAFFDESYDSTKFEAIMQDRLKSGFDFLDDYAKLTFAQLGLGFEASFQTARIPIDRLYAAASGETASMANNYFSILAKRNLANEITAAEGTGIAAQTLKYLFGPEAQLQGARTLSDKRAINDNLSALYAEGASQWLARIGSARSITSNLTKGASTAELVSQEIDGLPLSLPGVQELLFVPGGPNRITSSALVNSEGVTALLWETETFQEVTPPNNKVSLNFITSQKVSYLTFWAPSQFQISSISSGGKSVSHTLRHLETITDSQGNTTVVAKTGGSFTGAGLYLVTFPEAPNRTLDSVREITIQFSPGTRVHKLAGYSEQPVFSTYQWKANGGVRKLSGVADKLVSELVIILATPRKTISFLNWGYQTSPLARNGDPSYSPVRYAYGGWETPQSYANKLLDNQLEKVANGKASRFPFTEFDSFSARQEINDLGIYKVTPTLADLKEIYRSSSSQKPYIYSYGLDLPFSASTLADIRSPFFVEKTAGIDSLGLVASVAIQTFGTPLFPNVASTTVAERWAFRTASILGFQAFFPFSKSYINPETFPSIIEATPRWYEKNSNVVVDLAGLRVGDLLVGYEGKSLESAIVVAVPDAQTLVSGDLEAIRNQVSVVGINKSLKAAVLTSWENFSVAPSNFHVRRLVKNPNTDLKVFFTPREISVPQGIRVWLPDSEEMVPIGFPGINNQGNATGILPVKPVFDTTKSLTWSLLDIEATDFSFDPAKADKGNTYNNVTSPKPTEFYLVSFLENRRDQPITKEILTNSGKFPGAVVLAKFTSQPNQASMRIEGLYDSSWVQLLCLPGRNQTGTTHRLVAKVRGVEYEHFGVMAVNGHTGDDIQLTFRLRDTVVYKTMPMTVFSWASFDAIETADFLQTNNQALRNTILSDSTLSTEDSRYALNALKYLEVVNRNLYTNPNALQPRHPAFAPQLLSEAVMHQVGAYFLAHPEVTEDQVATVVSHIDDVAVGKLDIQVMAAKLGEVRTFWTQGLHSALEFNLSETEYMAMAIGTGVNTTLGFLGPKNFHSEQLRSELDYKIKQSQGTIVSRLRMMVARTAATLTAYKAKGSYHDAIQPILAKHKITVEEFRALISTESSLLNASQKKLVKDIRLEYEAQNPVTSESILLKVFPISSLRSFFESVAGQPWTPMKAIGGFVAFAKDLKMLTTPKTFYDHLRLDYFGNAFSSDPDVIVVVRFRTSDPDKFGIPWDTVMDPAGITQGQPFSGKGYVLSPKYFVPELAAKDGIQANISHGDVSLRWRDGTEIVVGVFDSSLKKFRWTAK